MIVCPNCGFQQPKDLFCAKCGINMDTYIPKDRSFIQKIVESSFFYIVLLCIVVSVTTFFTYEKILVYLEDKGSDPLSSQIDYIPIEKIPPKKDLQQLEISETFQPSPQLPQGGFLLEENAKSQFVEDQTQESSAVDQFSSGVIRVYFVALPSSSTLLQTAELRGGQYGVISDFAGSFASIPGENKNVLTQRSWRVSPSTSPQSNIFSLRTGESEEDNPYGQIGIIMDLTINEILETSVMLQPSVNIFLVEGDENNARRVQDLQSLDLINLNRGDAVFIFGLLPHRPPSLVERDLLPESLLSVMQSEDFLESLTEFFIVIEYAL